MPAMGGAAIAEEALLVAIGADRKIDDDCKPGLRETAGEIARQIENVMMGAARRSEEFRIIRIIVTEALVQIGADFIDGARDCRSNHRSDARTAGTEAFHGGDSRIGDAGEPPFPSGMGSADDTR